MISVLHYLTTSHLYLDACQTLRRGDEMNRRTVLLSLALVLLANIGISQPVADIELAAIVHDHSQPKDWQLMDDYAYGIDEMGVFVYDIMNPADPVFVHRILTTGMTRDVLVSDGIIYLRDSGEMLIYSAPDTYDDNPLLLSRVPFENTIYLSFLTMTLVENILYYTTDGLEMRYLDVQDPENPVDLGIVELTDNVVYDMIYEEGYLLVLESMGQFASRFAAFDMSIPDEPEFVSGLDLEHGAVGVTYEGGIAYVLVEEDTYEYHADPYLHLIDIADIQTPELLATYEVPVDWSPPYAGRPIVENGLVWFGTINNIYDPVEGGLRAIDVSNPDNIHQIGHWVDYYSEHLTLDGDNIFLDRMRVLDISDVDQPELIAEIDIPDGRVEGVACNGDLVYVMDGGPGLRFFDIEIPLEPELISTFDEPYMSTITLIDSIAFISINTMFADAYDVSDPFDPIRLSQIEAHGARPILVEPNHIITQSGDINTQHGILNIADVYNPEIVGTFDLGIRMTDGERHGDYFYAVCSDFIGIVDVSDLSNPLIVGNHPVEPEGYWDIEIDGQTAYLLSEWESLLAIDISNPTDPITIDSYQLYGSDIYPLNHLHTANGYAYVSNYSTFEIANIQDPENMNTVGFIDLPTRTHDFDIADNGYVYLAGTKALYILDISEALGVGEFNSDPSQLPTAFSVLPAYPNPFNASTVISVALPTPSNLSVNAFNVNGQRVMSLFDGYQTAGSHNFTLDASSLASGVYFVRASAPGYMDAVQKVTLVR